MDNPIDAELPSGHSNTVKRQRHTGIIVLFIILGILVAGGYMTVKTYNDIARGPEKIAAAWAQVENVYQRRADLIPNLVEVVKGYATHEQETLDNVIKARAEATSVKITPDILQDRQAFARYEKSQSVMDNALSKLLVASERYPDLKANRNFLELQSQIEGTENRIAVERKRFNDAVLDYNGRLVTFPGNLLAKHFDWTPKPYFQAAEGSSVAPVVSFTK